MAIWKRVVFAADCPDCPKCGDRLCLQCGDHYVECKCPGPTQDDEYEYTEIRGVLMARRKPK